MGGGSGARRLAPPPLYSYTLFTAFCSPFIIEIVKVHQCDAERRKTNLFTGESLHPGSGQHC